MQNFQEILDETNTVIYNEGRYNLLIIGKEPCLFMDNLNSPHYIKDVGKTTLANYEIASPFKHVSAAFNWLNTDFPSYHSHMHWEILLVVSGEILHTINGTDYIYKKGDACLIRPHDMHSLKFLKDHTGIYQHLDFMFDIDFAQKLIGLYCDYDELLNSPDILHFTLNDSSLNSIYNECLFTQNLSKENYEFNSKLIISKVLLDFFNQRTLFDPDYPIWLNNFLTYISHPVNFNKSATELSKSTPYSYSRLSRIFKQSTGITLIEYINEKKMIYAKRLLRTTTLTALQISELIGYNSVSSFNHLFRKTFNVTPTEYRKEHIK